MYENSIDQHKLDSSEYFINVEDIPETPETIKAYIPKMMPDIELGEGPIENIKLTTNPSIFVNAPECKVSGLKPVLTGQNFITIGHRSNDYPNFRSKAEYVNGQYIVRKHNKFLLGMQHHDIGSMYFTGSI